MEAVDPMAITKRRLTPAARTSSGAKGSWRIRTAVRNVFLPSWGTGKAEAGGLHSRSGRLPHELVTGRPKPEVYTAVRDVSLTSW